MKKSSIAVAVTVIIIAIAGAFYINNSYSLKKLYSSSTSKMQDISEEDNGDNKPGESTFGEYSHTLPSDEKINIRYLKSDGIVKIYSIYPVDNKSRYHISQSGGTLLYIAGDGHIWAFYNNGTKKKLTPDTYESIAKSEITKANPGYIWAEKPTFTPEGNIRFISNLPDTSASPKKSIWEIAASDGSMKKVYAAQSVDFSILGIRDDGKLMVSDGDNIAAIDTSNNHYENINAKNIHIISLSPNGTKFIYVKKSGNGNADFSTMYVMDSTGKKSSSLPGIQGFIATNMGAWYYDNSRYGFILKSLAGGRDKIGVLLFEEDSIKILSFNTEKEMNFSNNCVLRWAEDNMISVDTGDDVISIELK